MNDKDIIPHPLTFHVQIRQDSATQLAARNLQMFFAQPEVVAALNQANPRLVHFARVLQIPNNQPTDPQGIFALQIVIVYDGADITPLLQFFWDTPVLRGFFQQIYSLQVPGVKGGSPDSFDNFCTYINYNNITPLHSELHRGYNLSVDQVIAGFPPPPPLTTLA